MDLRQEIARRVDRLPADLQEEVLRFLDSLAATSSSGEALHQFSALLDSVSAREMMEAIEEGCEQIDTTGW